MFKDLGPGKRAALIGLGVTNRAVAAYLVSLGVDVVGYDQKSPEELSAHLGELEALGVHLILGPRSFEGKLSGFDYVFVTPGIRPDIPLVSSAAHEGAIITNEIDLLLHKAPGTVVGITGSSGKTTTTSLIGHILAKAGKPVMVGGNIGSPLVTKLAEMTPDTFVVVELSSFQLMTVRKSPQISLITNITPNHLDYHTSMDEYIQAKSHIFTHQEATGRVVLNADDPILAEQASQARGRVGLFSATKPVQDGTFLDGNLLMHVAPGKRAEEIMPISEIPLRGAHNVENVLAAAAITLLCGVSPETIRIAVQEFSPVEHRLEFVRELEGIKYYNDSIATSPARAIAGIRAFTEPIILIAGGYDKKLPFDEFVQEMPGRVKHVLLLGVTAPTIAGLMDRMPQAPKYSFCADLTEAVEEARKRAASGDVVLLSPAAASFDMFPNYRERGRIFKELVNSL